MDYDPNAAIISQKIIGDLDNDKDVDGVDFAKFAKRLGEKGCNNPRWCEGVDLDYSGHVDFTDFAEFAKRWLSEGL